MKRRSHPLWSAERGENGNVTVQRSVAERDDLEEVEYAQAVVASAWGLFGAGLIDNSGFDRAEMPTSVKDRFNLVAKQLKESGEVPPKVRSWGQLTKVLGSDKVKELKQAISQGMKVRQASKYFNLPFIVTADIIDDADVIGRKAMKEVVDLVSSGRKNAAVKNYGRVAQKVATLYSIARKTGNHKLAVDSAAEKYWEDYYGEYGKQLVKEVKKRVRAEVAYEWLRRCGVDDVAAKYWQNYFTDSDYGKALTETLPKKLSPSKKKDKKEEKKGNKMRLKGIGNQGMQRLARSVRVAQQSK